MACAHGKRRRKLDVVGRDRRPSSSISIGITAGHGRMYWIRGIVDDSNPWQIGRTADGGMTWRLLAHGYPGGFQHRSRPAGQDRCTGPGAGLAAGHGRGHRLQRRRRPDVGGPGGRRRRRTHRCLVRPPRQGLQPARALQPAQRLDELSQHRDRGAPRDAAAHHRRRHHRLVRRHRLLAQGRECLAHRARPPRAARQQRHPAGRLGRRYPLLRRAHLR